MVAKRAVAAAKRAGATAAAGARSAVDGAGAAAETLKAAAAEVGAGPRRAAPAARKTAARRQAAPPAPRVREDESPWTPKELREVRAELEGDIAQLRRELDIAEHDLVDLMRDSGDGAGDDQADAGAKTYEREQEISLANNARDILLQSEHALERLENGTYGICESCGNPIGKLRLQAAPRATLCMPCKKKQERR